LPFSFCRLPTTSMETRGSAKSCGAVVCNSLSRQAFPVKNCQSVNTEPGVIIPKAAIASDRFTCIYAQRRTFLFSTM
jgi:hypothetical protein